MLIRSEASREPFRVRHFCCIGQYDLQSRIKQELAGNPLCPEWQRQHSYQISSGGFISATGFLLPSTDQHGQSARVAAMAGPGEMLVLSTVKDLVASSDLRFDDRGFGKICYQE
jgi:hypothetical protein